MAEPSWFSAATVPNRLIAPDSNGNWWIEQDHFAADFAADVPPAVSHFMAESQVPITTDAFTHKVTNPAWKSKPTWYMVATADRSINPDQERMMAKRAHAKTVEANGASHAAYMSHPKATAKLIEEAATSLTRTETERRVRMQILTRFAWGCT
jgi:pimeloyl-ACP methyl ester carboxylesterase